MNCWCAALLQVCVYALLVLKTAQQAFLDSLPLFTVCTANTSVHHRLHVASCRCCRNVLVVPSLVVLGRAHVQFMA